MAAACLGLVGCALALETALASAGRDDASDALSRSVAVAVIAAVAVLDAGVGLRRVLALVSCTRAAAHPPEWGAVSLRAGHLLVVAAFGLSLLGREPLLARGRGRARDRGAGADRRSRSLASFTVGVGEVGFTVVAVHGRLAADGASSAVSADLRLDGGSVARTSRLRPVLLDRARAIWPVLAGYALQYEIAVDKGGVLDAAVAKLALAGGHQDSIRSPVVPHRVYVRLAPGSAPAGGPLFDVAIYRGRLLVGSGRLASGGALPFEGMVLRLPKVSRWVELRLVRDPGIVVALAGLALAAAGLVARRVGAGRAPKREG